MGFWDKIGGALSNPWVRGASAVAGLAGSTGLLHNSDGSAMTLGKTTGLDLGGIGNLSLTSLAGGANMLSGGAAALSGKDRMGGMAQMGLGGYNLLQNNNLSTLSGGLIGQDTKAGQFGNFGSLFSSGTANPSLPGSANSAQAAGVSGATASTNGGGMLRQPGAKSNMDKFLGTTDTKGAYGGLMSGDTDTKGAYGGLMSWDTGNVMANVTGENDAAINAAINKALMPGMSGGATGGVTGGTGTVGTGDLMRGLSPAATGATSDLGGGVKQTNLANGMIKLTMPDGSMQVLGKDGTKLWNGTDPAPNMSFQDKVLNGLANNPAQAIGAGALLANMFAPDPAEQFMKDYEARLARSGNVSPDSPAAQTYIAQYRQRRKADLDQQYAAAKANLEAQYAQRGMLDSSVYAEAQNKLEKEWMNTYSNLTQEAYDAWMKFATGQQAINQSAAETAAMPGKVVAAMNQPGNFSSAAQSLALSR